MIVNYMIYRKDSFGDIERDGDWFIEFYTTLSKLRIRIEYLERKNAKTQDLIFCLIEAFDLRVSDDSITYQPYETTPIEFISMYRDPSYYNIRILKILNPTKKLLNYYDPWRTYET